MLFVPFLEQVSKYSKFPMNTWNPVLNNSVQVRYFESYVGFVVNSMYKFVNNKYIGLLVVDSNEILIARINHHRY